MLIVKSFADPSTCHGRLLIKSRTRISAVMSNSPEVLRCEAAGEKGEEGAGRASQLRRGGKKDLRVIGCDSPPAELIRCLAAHYGLSDSNSNSDEPEKDSNILVFSKFFFFSPQVMMVSIFFFFTVLPHSKV